MFYAWRFSVVSRARQCPSREQTHPRSRAFDLNKTTQSASQTAVSLCEHAQNSAVLWAGSRVSLEKNKNAPLHAAPKSKVVTDVS